MIWMDTNHTFDPQHVISESRKAKLEPTRVLRAVKVWRPYDASQLIDSLDRIPNPALWAPNTSKGDVLRRTERGDLSKSQALWWTPLIVIPDMLAFFCDEKLSEMQMVSLYRSFIIRLAFLRQRAIVLGLFNETALSARRAPLLAEMIKMSRRVLPWGAGDPARTLSQTPDAVTGCTESRIPRLITSIDLSAGVSRSRSSGTKLGNLATNSTSTIIQRGLVGVERGSKYSLFGSHDVKSGYASRQTRASPATPGGIVLEW